MGVYTYPTGIEIDTRYIENEKGISSFDIEAIKDKIDKALSCGQYLRQEGRVEGHLSKDGEEEAVLFSQLPYIRPDGLNTPELMERLDVFRQHCQDDIDVVVAFGVGGSYLGGKVLFDVHCGSFWNSHSDLERDGYPRLYFSGNNVDTVAVSELIHALQLQAKAKSGYKVMLIVISKSGSTIEPMSNFMIIEQALIDAQIAYEVTAVTDLCQDDKETLLHKMAVENQWPIFSVPDGVGGRFSVFTEVGLLVGAAVGFDIESFLLGARAMDQICESANLRDNPALLLAVLKYISAVSYDRVIEVCMPYGACLKSLSEWYVQLLAESLGKKRSDGSHYGRTPVVAIGTTDMHAQVQEHQEGLYNKVVQFIRVADWDKTILVPDRYPKYAKLASLSGHSLADIMDVALESNAEAQAMDGRFNLCITLPKLNAFYLGQLMFLFCWAIFYESILADVDAFDQPGVEIYKRLLGSKLQERKQKA